MEQNSQLQRRGVPSSKVGNEPKKTALERKLGSIDLTGTATQARRYPQSAYRLADQRKNASPRA
jgi:hypothetical protein